jgi:hypothetical protein
MTLAVCEQGRIALSFRADEKVQTEMHLVEMEMVTAWQKPVRLALKPDTMRHLTKELVQWVFYHIQK